MTRQDLPDAILPKFFQHPYCPEGGVYTNVADSTMSFKTSASEIFISYVSGSATSDMVILIDGKETQTLSTTSSYTNMNYVSKGISGVKGKTVTVVCDVNTAPYAKNLITELETYAKVVYLEFEYKEPTWLPEGEYEKEICFNRLFL